MKQLTHYRDYEHKTRTNLISRKASQFWPQLQAQKLVLAKLLMETLEVGSTRSVKEDKSYQFLACSWVYMTLTDFMTKFGLSKNTRVGIYNRNR